jgi:aryl-alcohol dehydrogenase-like predicted oxidoreductase
MSRPPTAKLTETNLGKVLKGIARDRYYLATKVGSYGEARGDYEYSAARTERSLSESLDRLGVDYVDLIQCHDIAYVEEPADESLLAEVLDVLKPIHNFNFTRGRLEHRDLLVGPADESNGAAN